MKTAEQKQTEYVRCQLLRLLNGTAGGCSNSGLLTDQLRNVGVAITHTAVKSELRWLEETKLIAVDIAAGETLVVSITERGEDVANGLARVDGVAHIRR